MSNTTYLAFIQAAPGLEPLLEQELEGLLGDQVSASPQEGGVTARLSQAHLYQLCLATRFAESVRIRLKSFIARDFASLEKGLARLPWAAYLRSGRQVEFRVVCHRSRLWHTGAVIERVAGLFQQRFGVSQGTAEEGALRIHLRITGDAVQASVDAGGYRLHRRGYRRFSVDASVRETLAAATVSQVLRGKLATDALVWDPFCGAGTMGLEALMLGRGLLPGAMREFAFQTWPTYQAELFEVEKAAISQQLHTRRRFADLRLLLSDRDQTALGAAEKNVESAGLSQATQFALGSVEEVAESVPRGAVVISNPPYGKRLKEEGGVASLLSVLEKRPDLRPVALLIGGQARKKLPPQFRAKLRTRSGGENVSVRVLARGKSPS